MFKIEKTYRRMLALSALVGVLVGLFGAAFYYVWHALDHQLWPVLQNPVNRIWFSTLIGLIIGLILKFLFDPGSMATIVMHFHKAGELPAKDNLPIQPVSLLGLLGGQSAGPEGALTQAGGSLGSYVAKRADAPKLTRVLTLAGMGAGFGAFLGAPVGGAMLWLEMLHTRGLEYYEAVIPTIVCSAVGYLVMLVLVGHGLVPPWHITVDIAPSYWTPFIAVLIGLSCGPVAKAYSLMFRYMGKVLNHRTVPLIAQTTAAGLIIGLLGWLVPDSYFYGGGQMLHLMTATFPIGILLAILVSKMIAAAVTIRGHWQGGLVIPHMFMGLILGKIIAMYIPGIDAGLSMLCCMAAFNAATTQTPLASALIVLALTGVGLPVPIFLASIAGFIAGQGVVLIDNKQSRDQPHNFHLEPRERELVP
jgi:H+/Cl- antiporter ClcA